MTSFLIASLLGSSLAQAGCNSFGGNELQACQSIYHPQVDARSPQVSQLGCQTGVQMAGCESRSQQSRVRGRRVLEQEHLAQQDRTRQQDSSRIPEEGQFLQQQEQSQYLPQQSQFPQQQGQYLPQQGQFMPLQGQVMPREDQFYRQQEQGRFHQQQGQLMPPTLGEFSREQDQSQYLPQQGQMMPQENQFYRQQEQGQFMPLQGQFPQHQDQGQSRQQLDAIRRHFSDTQSNRQLTPQSSFTIPQGSAFPEQDAVNPSHSSSRNPQEASHVILVGVALKDPESQHSETPNAFDSHESDEGAAVQSASKPAAVNKQERPSVAGIEASKNKPVPNTTDDATKDQPVPSSDASKEMPSPQKASVSSTESNKEKPASDATKETAGSDSTKENPAPNTAAGVPQKVVTSTSSGASNEKPASGTSSTMDLEKAQQALDSVAKSNPQLAKDVIKAKKALSNLADRMQKSNQQSGAKPNQPTNV